VKQAVNKAIEDARNQKIVKANLAADAVLYVSEELQALLARLGDELRFVTITSTATLKPLASAPADVADSALAGLKVAIVASPHGKCVRCWHHREDVGQHQTHPELCGRCVDNVSGSGEVRHHA
jgi:isoleucyl-tRNA synthetase